MAQDYKLVSFEKSDFQDRQGNYWCTAVFEGFGEPAKWVMQPKTVPTITVGETYYGEIKDWTSANNRVFPRFYREKKEEAAPTQTQLPTPNAPQVKKEWVDHSDDIQAQWALGRAYEKQGATDAAIMDARWLVAGLEIVKGTDTKEPEQSVEEKLAQRQAERDAQRIREIAREDEVHPVNDTPIDLNDIPF